MATIWLSEKESAYDAILELVEYGLSAFNNNETFFGAIYLDCSDAFDTVNHIILLMIIQKLELGVIERNGFPHT